MIQILEQMPQIGIVCGNWLIGKLKKVTISKTPKIAIKVPRLKS